MVSMARTLLAVLCTALLLGGCGITARTDAEKQREAFRLSHVPSSERSAFLSGNSQATKADHLYAEATDARELKERRQLLASAAARYRDAIEIFEQMLGRIEDAADRKYVEDVIRHTRASLELTVRSLPDIVE
jgi:hypothetical protein